MRDIREEYLIMVELPDKMGYIAEFHRVRNGREALLAAMETGLTRFALARDRISIIKH